MLKYFYGILALASSGIYSCDNWLLLHRTMNCLGIQKQAKTCLLTNPQHSRGYFEAEEVIYLSCFKKI